jgi:hypothetical protein
MMNGLEPAGRGQLHPACAAHSCSAAGEADTVGPFIGLDGGGQADTTSVGPAVMRVAEIKVEERELLPDWTSVPRALADQPAHGVGLAVDRIVDCAFVVARIVSQGAGAQAVAIGECKASSTAVKRGARGLRQLIERLYWRNDQFRNPHDHGRQGGV